jgi:translation initiation factor 1A
MYQASIRDKKKHKKFYQTKSDNYELNSNYEEYAYVKKLLGNCRVQLITNSGHEAIGIIRGTLRKFTNRVIIEAGDIVVISKRDYQKEKVDVVHKYNTDQIVSLMNEKKLSKMLVNAYNYKHTDLTNNDVVTDDNNIHFANSSDEYEDNDSDEESHIFQVKNPNRKHRVTQVTFEDDKDNEIDMI